MMVHLLYPQMNQLLQDLKIHSFIVKIHTKIYAEILQAFGVLKESQNYEKVKLSRLFRCHKI